MSTPFLSVKRVLELHQAGVTGNPGHGGLRLGVDCIDGALGSAVNAELYATENAGRTSGLVFAVAVLVYLVRRHCFVDGNKRVGWSAMVDVLETLGLTIIADDDEAEEFVKQVVAGTLEREEATRWVARRLAAAT